MSFLRNAVHRVPGSRRFVHALRRLRAAALDRPQVAELDYRSARIVIHSDSPAVEHSRLHPVAKEPWTVSWLEASVRTDDVLWDIGANVGGYSLVAAAAGARAVVAVEPSYANYAELCENIELNGCGEIITALPIVLGASTELVALEHENRLPGATHRVTEEHGEPVLGFALDDLVERFELPEPNLIKLDVDGAEADVLAGAGHALARPELRSLLIEIESEGENDVVELVEEAGFRLVTRYDERDGERLHGVWYGVFDRA